MPPRRALRALTVALALGCAGARALADAEEDQIAALVRRNDSARAAPLALRRARRLATDAAAWDRALTLANWNSDRSVALEALRNLARLRPDDRAVRLALAQRLLWTRATREALPHARWLVAREDERDPTALEVAAWVLLAEGQLGEAEAVLQRWIDTAPQDPRPRWVLADATHWTADWRLARAQYVPLIAARSQVARARERLSGLRHDHPTELRIDGVGWIDNVGVSYAALALDGTYQLPFRMVLLSRVEAGRWAENTATVNGQLGVLTAQARLRAEFSSVLRPEVSGGVETDTAGNLAPIGSAGLRVSVGGRLFGGAWMQYDRLRVSYEAALRDVRAWGPAWTLYAEPHRLVFLSTEGSLQWISDNNFRTRVLGAVGMHNVGALQVEPRAFVQYDSYREQRFNAEPYFTPTAPITLGSDVTVRYTLRTMLQVEGVVGVVYQDGVFAVRPGLRARFEIADRVRLSCAGGYVGSPQYNQLRIDATLGYLF